MTVSEAKAAKAVIDRVLGAIQFAYSVDQARSIIQDIRADYSEAVRILEAKDFNSNLVKG